MSESQTPLANLRQEIQDGYISLDTKKLIKDVLKELNIYHPDSWDKKFCEDMLSNTKQLSCKQKDQLIRILDDILMKTEHPSFTPKFEL
tara:strand:- start:231 stop:497 length:267 start_codon:yes stop_codon:yes gene_type:complete